MGFKFRRFYQREDSNPESLPLTPLLDIIFLVTIFFVLTSGAIFQQMLEIDIPESSTSELSLEKNWSLIVYSSEKILFNRQEYDLISLGKKVEEELSRIDAREIQVSLAGGKTLEYGVLINVFDILRRHGITKISLIVEDEGT